MGDVDWERILANYDARVRATDLGSFQQWAGTRTVVLTFLYGANDHAAHASPAWLRLMGGRVRARTVSQLCRLEHPVASHVRLPAWLSKCRAVTSRCWYERATALAKRAAVRCAHPAGRTACATRLDCLIGSSALVLTGNTARCRNNASADGRGSVDVLILLVGLGLLSELLVESRLFGILAVRAARLSQARPSLVLCFFVVAMYLVSGLVNNLTALMLVLPVLHILLKLMGVHQRYLSWTLGLLLVACNLGGAATPIGDFPAILLLGGSGRMTFRVI